LTLLTVATAVPVISGNVGARAAQKTEAGPVVFTNQQFLEDLDRGSAIDIEDIGQVFDHILSNLPARVDVYPTENYYYFRFYHGGVEYAGNIRLAASDRDQGLVHFAYFPAANAGRAEGQMHYKPLGRDDGVGVTRLSDLSYSVDYRDRTVIFDLNDLSGVKPPDDKIAAAEMYLGPVYDESGIQFYLIYNPLLKIFHYVLNEEGPVPDILIPASYTDRIVFGRRTGFAFYLDAGMDRKILIGVHAANAAVNNYYDGPFDQLPDNFNKDERLRKAIEESDPTAAGLIDRFGYYKSGIGRYLIGPYTQYSQEQDLVNFHLCATNPQLHESLYYSCFAIQGGGARQ
jgi:hypothetical protein